MPARAIATNPLIRRTTPKPKYQKTSSDSPKMQIKPVTPAPTQLDLFGMVSDARYVNLIPFYEALPRTVPGS